jgi:hypothetical protein
MEFVYIGWNSLLGKVDIAKLVDKFFKLEGYTTSIEYHHYPFNYIKTANKSINLYYEDRAVEASIKAFLLSSGVIIWQLIIPGTPKDISVIRYRRYSTSKDQEKLSPAFEIIFKQVLKIFEVNSVSELYVESTFESSNYNKRMEKLGITPIHDQLHFNLHVYFNCFTEEDYQRTCEEINKLSSVNFSNELIIPKQDPISFNGISGQIKLDFVPILLTPKKDFRLLEDLHIGLTHYTNGTNLLIALLFMLQGRIMNLFDYIGDSNKTSWIYVQTSWMEFSIYFEKILHEFQSSLTSAYRFSGSNYEDPKMIEQLAQYYKYAGQLPVYESLKENISQKLSFINNLLADKGEKEEKEATNNLVQIIGLLAVLGVISELLPIFEGSYEIIIRVGTVGLIAILIGVIYYRTLYKNKSRRDKALRLMQISDLKQKIQNLKNYKIIAEQQMIAMESDDLKEIYQLEIDSLEKLISNLVEQVSELEN